MQDRELIVIWMTLPHDMMMLMHHIVGGLNLTNDLRDDKQFRSDSSIENGDPPHPPHPPSSPLPP